MIKQFRFGVLAAGILALAACGSGDEPGPTITAEEGRTVDASSTAADIAALASPGADVDAARISAARQTPGDWLTYGGTYDEQRHSLLDSVNTENVSDLGVAWTYDLATARGVEATPIVVDGVMYVTSAWSVVYALDAQTGEELWTYDPGVDRAHGVNACCDVVNRGVAIWEGKVFVGTIDGRLVALDAGTGEVQWDKVTVDQSRPYTITGAPRVVKGRVLIGNGGAELGVRGYISAYDAGSGKMDWRFYTAPNPDKVPDGAASDSAFETIGNISWGDEGEWVTAGGGGTVWDSIVYDEVNDRVIFGVGNGSPWNRDFRDPSGGDNLFLSSIVAVDADTGEYAWHFQTTPGDNWDYTATQTIILADLELDGETRRVAMQAPKNGFFYVIDAATGEFISGNNFVPQTWTTGLDEAGRPIEVEGARYGLEPVLQSPGPLGAHNWHPMAFSPDLGLAYIPAQEIPQVYQKDLLHTDGSARWNTGANFGVGVPVEIPDGMIAFLRAGLKGRLIAWDPIKQEARWSVEHASPWNGGVLSTAGGLVFQGQLGGTFSAYDGATGELKWQADVKSGAASGPGTYQVDGEQYVTITTGWGSAYSLVVGIDPTLASASPAVGKVVTFKLGGRGQIADHDLPLLERLPQAERFGDEAFLAAGITAYERNCAVCHGVLGIGSGVLPDLRWSGYTGDEAAFRSVVIDGALASNGMVSFADQLSPEDVEAVRAYLVHRAHETGDIE